MKQMIAVPHLFEELFHNGLGRSPGRVIEPASENGFVHLNLGSGNSPIPLADNLQLPDWDAERDGLRDYDDESIDVVHAYHFLEHLDPAVFMKIMREVERVLIPGGVFNICVPYARSDIAYQDPTHRTFFTEETWQTLLMNSYYHPDPREKVNGWCFAIAYNIIAGVAGRNLCVFTQLEKEMNE